MTKTIEYCKCCGAKLSKYKVKLTPIIVRALIKFRRAVLDKGENSVHLLKDMKDKEYELTRHEWNNFSRVRFHAFAVKDKNNKKAGHWLMTRRADTFLNGEMAVPDYVYVFRNKIVEYSPKLVKVEDVIGSTPYVETKEDIEYASI